MALRNRMRHRIQIKNLNPVLQSGALNEYGDVDETQQDYWELGPLQRCLVIPIATTEDETDRETLSHQYDIYLEPDVEIYGTSTVILFADTDNPIDARVLGEPQVWPTAAKSWSHQVVRVESIRG